VEERKMNKRDSYSNQYRYSGGEKADKSIKMAT
jgi:hypothetical protein